MSDSDLRPLVDAAEDHAVADVRVAGIVAAAFVDLDRQFARRREHQCLDRAPPFGARLGREQLEDRQREGRRLARPGLGAAQQVAAFECGDDLIVDAVTLDASAAEGQHDAFSGGNELRQTGDLALAENQFGRIVIDEVVHGEYLFILLRRE